MLNIKERYILAKSNTLALLLGHRHLQVNLLTKPPPLPLMRNVLMTPPESRERPTNQSQLNFSHYPSYQAVQTRLSHLNDFVQIWHRLNSFAYYLFSFKRLIEPTRCGSEMNENMIVTHMQIYFRGNLLLSVCLNPMKEN